MNIEVRQVGKYVDVTVHADRTNLELGLLNTIERADFAEHLREVADEIWPLEDEGTND